LAIAVFLIVCFFYNQDNFEYFKLTIFFTVSAAFIECLSEPFYTLMLINMDFSMRAKAEGISLFIKNLMVYALIYNKMGLLAYGIS
jgi:hypothetical protein